MNPARYIRSLRAHKLKLQPILPRLNHYRATTCQKKKIHKADFLPDQTTSPQNNKIHSRANFLPLSFPIRRTSDPDLTWTWLRPTQTDWT